MIFALMILGCLIVGKVLQHKRDMEEAKNMTAGEQKQLQARGYGGRHSAAAAPMGQPVQGGAGQGPTNSGQPLQGHVPEGQPPAVGP